MKALIFALIVLLAIDLVGYHGAHVRAFGDHLSAAGDEIGSWVFQS